MTVNDMVRYINTNGYAFRITEADNLEFATRGIGTPFPNTSYSYRKVMSALGVQDIPASEYTKIPLYMACHITALTTPAEWVLGGNR